MNYHLYLISNTYPFLCFKDWHFCSLQSHCTILYLVWSFCDCVWSFVTLSAIASNYSEQDTVDVYHRLKRQASRRKALQLLHDT